MLYHTCIIIIILFFCIYNICSTQLGSSTENVMKTYGTSKDDIKTLLDRIEWGNHYQGRLDLKVRYGLYAIIIGYLMNIIYQSKFNSIYMLQSIMIIWMTLIGLNSFFSHHSDKFVNSHIDENLNWIRQKLQLKRDVEHLKSYQTKFNGKDRCYTFIYKSFP